MTSVTQQSRPGGQSAPPPDQASRDLDALAADLDAGTARIAALAAEDRAVVERTVEALNTLHKDVLTAFVRAMRTDDRSRELLYELVDDPAVRMALAMHGIIRPDPTTLARQVIERVRPGLQSHGGDVELSHLEAGVAYVRLQGACNGCSMAAVTMREGVEQALVAGVPGIVGVEVLPNDPPQALIPLGSLTVRSSTAAEELRAAGWTRAAALGEIAEGSVRPVTLGPATPEAVVVNVGGQLTAYVNECAHQAMPLDDAIVDSSRGTITCAYHGFCYDADNGECLTMPGAQLQQLPLRVADDAVWIRAGA